MNIRTLASLVLALGLLAPPTVHASPRSKAWMACLAKPLPGCEEEQRFDRSGDGRTHVVAVWRCGDQRVTFNVTSQTSGMDAEVLRRNWAAHKRGELVSDSGRALDVGTIGGKKVLVTSGDSQSKLYLPLRKGRYLYVDATPPDGAALLATLKRLRIACF